MNYPDRDGAQGPAFISGWSLAEIEREIERQGGPPVTSDRS
jgi:hypothetical protein